MHSIRVRVAGLALLAALAGIPSDAQNAGNPQAPTNAGKSETGYALKKPVFGGACDTCPWGSIAEIVKAALQPYGWDVQICYGCAGGPREARMVAGAMTATPENTPGAKPAPPGPVDFGATESTFVWWAYQGNHDFAKDPEGPRKQLRAIANIQEPTYYVTAVRADSGITDLHQILGKRLPVKILASAGVGGLTTREVLAYFGITTKEKLDPLGIELRTETTPENRKNVDVFMGWAALNNASSYQFWYEVSQKYDLKYLELPKDLREKMVRGDDLEEHNIPVAMLRGIDRPIPTVVREGMAIYGRTDMPDEFAYTLAKALDEHQDLFQWANSSMNFSYNSRTVWKTYDVPLHPGAERYYKERGYMK